MLRSAVFSRARTRRRHDIGRKGGDVMVSGRSPALGRLALAATAGAALFALAPQADARVTRIVIDSTTPIAGQPYEQLTGRAFGELDPRDPQNRLITDIKLAPRNKNGKVE